MKTPLRDRLAKAKQTRVSSRIPDTESAEAQETDTVSTLHTLCIRRRQNTEWQKSLETDILFSASAHRFPDRSTVIRGNFSVFSISRRVDVVNNISSKKVNSFLHAPILQKVRNKVRAVRSMRKIYLVFPALRNFSDEGITKESPASKKHLYTARFLFLSCIDYPT